MKSISGETLAQAVTSRTMGEFYWSLFKLTMRGVFTEWIPAVGGFLLGLALRLIQDHYGYTVKNDGWLKVYWPWGLAFVFVCAYHALQANWRVHRATIKHYAYLRLQRLQTRGSDLDGDFEIGTRGGTDFWSKQVRLWTNEVSELLEKTFPPKHKDAFLSTTNLALDLSGGPITDRQYLKRRISNLEDVLRDLDDRS